MNRLLRETQEALEQDRNQLRFRGLRVQEDPREARQSDDGVPVEPLIEAMQEPEARAADPDLGRQVTSNEPEAEAPGRHTPPRDSDGDVDMEPNREDGDHDMDGDGLNVPVPEDDENDALALRLKSMKRGQKGKELDPRVFDDHEWDVFRDADEKQWIAHIASGAVRLVPAKEVANIDPSRILPIPARFVRTNKGKDGQELNAKSRLVVPGHLAPKEEVRTDAPVAPQVAFHLLLSLAVERGWTVCTFDVADAFLSGRENTRRLYVRPPREGIKGVPQGSVIELVKGVFGLKESPRLWWLKLRDAVLEAGFQELKSVPGTFKFMDRSGQLPGFLVVHVDDGI
jgi:hypothetical protein